MPCTTCVQQTMAMEDFSPQVNYNKYLHHYCCHFQLTRSVDLRACWWPNVEVHLTPDTKQQELNRVVSALTDHYAVLYMGWGAYNVSIESEFRGDVAKADEQLSRGLREHITVERNTVWRDMAAMERKYAAVTVKQATAPLGFRAK
ncbi:hypothetical protein VOLCADRAFT_99526 [Volvox carteri f. nagariensis]|uniref:Uncharacterized protein n=1 Tax=Volvox carteri f. nagariensis TaxID=3068 RepID=D8UHZ9_VOLCA|nr:uncharacterized protein VOLCADRAFT_99526 [Volvox carteri f. nagariensis]EFJ40649.1 hypothetical protein VOLCADRAFT_99526 [Volvox carteri f. nagariensis]|eukprot:XP_002958275.1 hypothetical protein VOLCADRAFT_99526 [Volvox carteri f. nagariensis]